MVVEEEGPAADRLDQLVGRFLRGKRPRVASSDAEERQAILAAARLAAVREGYPRMSPRFRRKLARRLRDEGASGFSRRELLAGGTGLAAGSMAGAALGLAVQPQLAGQMASLGLAPRVVLQAKPDSGLGRWVDTGLKLADLKEGEPKRVSAGAIGALVTLYKGQLLGTSAFCSHLPCELTWQPEQGNLLCACHPLTFTLEGIPQPANFTPPPLPIVKVRVVNGMIQVWGT
jgi:nitrite reductase/ring-hydroxylating ferredoxin subunit